MVFVLVHRDIKATKSNILDNVKKFLIECKIKDIDQAKDETLTCHVALKNSRVMLIITS